MDLKNPSFRCKKMKNRLIRNTKTLNKVKENLKIITKIIYEIILEPLVTMVHLTD